MRLQLAVMVVDILVSQNEQAAVGSRSRKGFVKVGLQIRTADAVDCLG